MNVLLQVLKRQESRVGGRPRALSDEDIIKAKAMLRNPEISAKKVADTLGVSVSTLYAYIPGGRNAIDD